MLPITELEIRAALLGVLEMSGKNDSLLIEELAVERGNARIDVAMVCDRLMGFEIKSDLDTLDRLSNQIHAYNRVFDEITLVAGREFIRVAPNVIPSWWGLIEARRASHGTVTLTTIRAPVLNQNQSSHSLASLLWKDEAVDLLQQHRATLALPHWSKTKIYDLLAQSITKDEIKSWVATKLKSRTTWRNSAPSTLDDDLLHRVAM